MEISLKEYNRLLESSAKLNALEVAGVDNWSGYGYAMEILENADKVVSNISANVIEKKDAIAPYILCVNGKPLREYKSFAEAAKDLSFKDPAYFYFYVYVAADHKTYPISEFYEKFKELEEE